MSLNIPNMHQEMHGQKQKGQRFRCPQIDEKPLDFWQQSKTRGFDSDLFTF
ncbi:hypothetical protein [Brucella inopinata]|uniref:hypothetical protein n=1 Tax=Brucella inopinata TaxID=1218315 RepID=UPI001314EDEA|nr:hypothetical protein [Brucella inopinata]